MFSILKYVNFFLILIITHKKVKKRNKINIENYFTFNKKSKIKLHLSKFPKLCFSQESGLAILFLFLFFYDESINATILRPLSNHVGHREDNY